MHLDYYSSSAKKWVPAHSALTSSAGRVAFTVKPAGTTKYELVFRGSATLASAHSGAATVLVTKVSTTLSVTESTAIIVPGEKDTIGGLLLAGASPVSRATVRLYRYSASAHKWILHATWSTSRTGEVRFSVTPGSTTSYELVYPGSSIRASTHSGVATVAVTKAPTTLSIREAATTIAAGHQDYISGVLLTGSTPVKRHVVYLYYFSNSTKKWLPESATLTSSAGKASFTVKPRSSVEYQLVFRGSTGLYAAESGVAAVTVTN